MANVAFSVLAKAVMKFARVKVQDEMEVDMDEQGRLERDPVCGMMVGEWEHQFVYRGVGYAFCSLQCRERFASGPGLYVGRRGLKAPKQKGVEVIKRRRMVLGVPLTQTQFVELQAALLSMMGVIAVRPVESIVDGSCDLRGIASGTRTTNRIEAVEMTYDLLQATARQLERKIAALNVSPSSGWGEKLQRDFIHYLEECELDDLAIRDGDLVRRGRPTASGFQTGVATRIAHTELDLAG